MAWLVYAARSMTRINHIATQTDWDRRTANYAPENWRDEGFVHCSTDDQLVRTANRFFAGRGDLVLLKIDTARLVALVVWEGADTTGEDFPHIYGAINIDAVVSAVPFASGPDETFDEWDSPLN